jgi:hypothetical protein
MVMLNDDVGLVATCQGSVSGTQDHYNSDWLQQGRVGGEVERLLGSLILGRQGGYVRGQQWPVGQLRCVIH